MNFEGNEFASKGVGAALQERFQEEVADCKKYRELAQEARKEGHLEMARILDRISKDEHSHAYVLVRYLEDTDTNKRLWESIK